MFYKHIIIAARENVILKSQGSRAQLKQTLTTIMVTLKYNYCSHSNGNEIKSVWLVISEAGNAVCGVVHPPLMKSSEIYCLFLSSVDFI